MKSSNVLNGLLLVVALVSFGCASNKVQPSGFLGDNRVYNGMQPDTEVVGIMVNKSAPYPLAGFDSFIVPPVSVYLNNAGQKRGVSDEALREVAENFRQDVIKQLGSRYQTVSAAAPNVAILRIAITDVDPKVTATSTASGQKVIAITGATMEVDLIDSMTGRRLVAAMARTAGANNPSGPAQTDTELEEWAEMIGSRLEKSHG